MTLVWAAIVGSHTDKLVLLALADNANDQGECYPSLTRIADKCEMGRRTAIRSIQNLESAGHISKAVRAGRTTVYMVHPVSSANLALVPNSHQCQSGTSANVTPTSANAAPLPPISPSLINPPPLDPPLKTITNRQRVRARGTASEGKPQTEPEGPPPSNLNVEAWHRWEQYRQAIRKPIKPASKLAAQRKLAAYGTDQGAVVEQSVANGWQGIFPLKGGDREPHETPKLTWRPPPDEDERDVPN